MNTTERFGDFNLTSRETSLSFGVLGYSQETAKNLENTFDLKSNDEFDKITSHSPIIGWAYDGNPIYGPFGYSDPDNINSSLKILTSSYKKDVSKVINRPSGFDDGFFNRFMNALIFAFPIAIIAAFKMAPLVRPLVNKIASKD